MWRPDRIDHTGLYIRAVATMALSSQIVEVKRGCEEDHAQAETDQKVLDAKGDSQGERCGGGEAAAKCFAYEEGFNR